MVEVVKVYVASPYTKGDVGSNVHRQMATMDVLMDMGFTPFIPLLYHYQDIMFKRSYDDWLNLCLDWVAVCDCVLILDGESSGADKEVELATELGIPIFYSLMDLKEHYKL